MLTELRKALFVSSLMLIVLVSLISAAEKPAEKSVPMNGRVFIQQEYPLNEETPATDDLQKAVNKTMALGAVETTDLSPGITVGNTWYDKQHNGRMTRMVDWGYDAENGLTVHFLWLYMPDQVFEDRAYAYNAYRSNAGTFCGPYMVTDTAAGDYGGYVALDVTNDNRAVAGGHARTVASYGCQTYWDSGPAACDFGVGVSVPDSVVNAATGGTSYGVLWPSMAYQEIPGQTPVLHLFAQASETSAADPQAIVYFRKVGINGNGDFDYPPYVVDTVFDIAQDVCVSSTSGKVALVWIANRPDDGDCDTCSSQQGQQYVQWDNDIYYQVSYDYGATFEERVNLTQNEDGVEGYRPYSDLQSLIDSDDYLHIVYSARFWPADANSGGQAGLYRCNMFHWGENLGTGGYDGLGDPVITTAANLEWDQTTCAPGAWNLNGCKMSISECDGKFYYVYVQFNDVPNGVENDCAQRGIDGSDISGAANGELYVAVSTDGGMTWDIPTNITNSRTPGCDPYNDPGNPCASDVWPSAAKFGTDLTGTAGIPSEAIVDPTGSYSGSHYLDIQYILDKDAGAIVSDEGTWQLAEVKWIRLACYEPAPYIPVWISPLEIDYPTYTTHGVQLDTPLVITNNGNADLNATVTLNETSGPVSGWLSSDLAGDITIPTGLNNTLTGTISLNAGGVVNDPGTIVYLEGNVTITGNQEGSPAVIPIRCWVTDTVIVPGWDTVTSCCVALTVGNNGNYGNMGGPGENGGVNLDYFNCGDCDYVEAGALDTVPGDASIYIYDGSPVVCWTDETDTVRCNYSMFGQSYTSEHGFIPVSHEPAADMGNYDLYQAKFMTRDSGLMFEQNWYAPHEGEYCGFMVEHLRVYANDGQSHAGLAVGEAIDWDIPSDSGLWNNSGFDSSRRLIYQTGSEFADSLGDALECQDNDLRYGGIAFIAAVENGDESHRFHNAYTMDNSTQLYPTSSFESDSLWKYMGGISDYSMSDSINSDLHTVCTYRWNQTITAADTLEIYTLFASTYSGEMDFLQKIDMGKEWACVNLGIDCGCCEIMGDFNHSGAPLDISDLVFLVTYMFSGGPELPCPEEGDCNGDGYCCDIQDLVCWVDCMFGLMQNCPDECP